MAKVAVLRTKPSTVLDDYARLMDLAEYKKALPKDKNLLLKLNLSWSLYYPACSTEPWQLEGVVAKLKEDGYKEIIPVENKTVVTDVWKGAKQNLWLRVLKRYGLWYKPLTEVNWVRYKPKHEMLALDKIFPHGHRVPQMFFGKSVCHLNTLKTHGHTTTTGAIKNSFGGLITERRHHCHKMIHEVLVDLLQIQKEIHPGIFAVADGTVAGDGAGPRTMMPRIANLILASEDQVAIDAVSARIMGFDPMKIPYIRVAHDRGLGCGDVNQIDMVGDDVSNVNLHFSTGRSPVIFFDQLFRKKIKAIEPWLFHTKLFYFCILGSELYHDRIWYPLIGKPRINRFMKTDWGKLWKKYKKA